MLRENILKEINSEGFQTSLFIYNSREEYEDGREILQIL